MRYTLIAVLIALCVMFSLTSAAGEVPTKPPASIAHWAKNGCSHGHSVAQSKRAIRQVMRSPQRVTKRKGRKVYHYANCSRSQRIETAMRTAIKRYKVWRRSYSVSWKFKWQLLPQVAKNWTRSTSYCESKHDPTTNTGNGFYGAFQWVPKTWYAAGGDRKPHRASWHHQAVLAWYWHLGNPRGQWPVCGE